MKRERVVLNDGVIMVQHPPCWRALAVTASASTYFPVSLVVQTDFHKGFKTRKKGIKVPQRNIFVNKVLLRRLSGKSF